MRDNKYGISIQSPLFNIQSFHNVHANPRFINILFYDPRIRLLMFLGQWEENWISHIPVVESLSQDLWLSIHRLDVHTGGSKSGLCTKAGSLSLTNQSSISTPPRHNDVSGNGIEVLFENSKISLQDNITFLASAMHIYITSTKPVITKSWNANNSGEEAIAG